MCLQKQSLLFYADQYHRIQDDFEINIKPTLDPLINDIRNNFKLYTKDTILKYLKQNHLVKHYGHIEYIRACLTDTPFTLCLLDDTYMTSVALFVFKRWWERVPHHHTDGKRRFYCLNPLIFAEGLCKYVCNGTIDVHPKKPRYNAAIRLGFIEVPSAIKIQRAWRKHKSNIQQ